MKDLFCRGRCFWNAMFSRSHTAISDSREIPSQDFSVVQISYKVREMAMLVGVCTTLGEDPHPNPTLRELQLPGTPAPGDAVSLGSCAFIYMHKPTQTNILIYLINNQCKKSTMQSQATVISLCFFLISLWMWFICWWLSYLYDNH